MPSTPHQSLSRHCTSHQMLTNLDQESPVLGNNFKDVVSCAVQHTANEYPEN